jgi:hypothetical protein
MGGLRAIDGWLWGRAGEVDQSSCVLAHGGPRMKCRRSADLSKLSHDCTVAALSSSRKNLAIR